MGIALVVGNLFPASPKKSNLAQQFFSLTDNSRDPIIRAG